MRTQLKTTWNGGIKGQGVIASSTLEAPIAIPDTFGGTGEGADPKTLLVAAAAACYSMTLVAILQNKKLPVAGLSMESDGSDGQGGSLAIDHHITIALLHGATSEQAEAAQAALQAADRACAIGNMLKKADATIRIEGMVSVAA